ncbi:aspartate aminotransferase family protein [Raineyella sp. W15-4]|uniref:aspartate aminotransferase family protein n=1 Tax=Raineyella sp. W15-4 TaxID=3081651 RepID=UPI002954C74F|nr:aspartate aminotransferase family protein [Raineyella sp. W15-4]WOQ15783.1 aspartate aminotransferase family protein [Raineyella sp. W15-4]
MSTFDENKRYLSPALARSTDIVAASGSGSYLTGTDGTRYIDWIQGIAVNSLGHCHPRVVAAVQRQTETLMTAAFNAVGYEATGELARRIAELAPGELGCTFFSNGGAEATDGALKLARVATNRPAIIAFRGSFHGRTFGATTVTGSNAAYRKWVEPLVGGVYFTPYPSPEQCPEGLDTEERGHYALTELQRLLDYIVAPETVAAILMEPVQGEGGYHVPPTSFVKELRRICDQHGILLIFDEIQAGYGRTGKMFASEHFDVVPDIVTLGKAIAGGVPMSAIVSTPEIMARWATGTHGTTFGGNPIAAVAALAVLDEYAESAVLENCREQGSYLRAGLERIADRVNIVSDVRGLGLMLAIELNHLDGRPGGDLVATLQERCRRAGLLLLNCGVRHNGIRFAPPLNVTRDVLDDGLAILEEALVALDTAELGSIPDHPTGPAEPEALASEQVHG